jgi:sodium-dependent dicarboxylate transporter 2/3/5
MAATKFRFDLNLARVILKPFGGRPRWVLLGLMVITAVFSIFMSNMATTAMRLSILIPVLTALSAEDRGRTAFVLAIPTAANIGGIGTPIGTPPNAVALKYIMELHPISFGAWMLFGVPFVIVLLLVAWWLLCRLFPIASRSIDLDIKSKFLKNRRAVIVYVTFALTVVLWMHGGIHGMNSYVVAMIPVAIFFLHRHHHHQGLKDNFMGRVLASFRRHIPRQRV